MVKMSGSWSCIVSIDVNLMRLMMSRALAKLTNKPLPTISPEQLKQKWELKKLKGKHKTIVALHLQGLNRVDIGAIAECTPEYVSMVLKQPVAKEYMAEMNAYMDQRLEQSFGKAVEVIHETLDSDDEEIQLKAARLALEATGRLKGSEQKTRSAEDVVAAILANASTIIVGQNVQVNQGD